MPATLFMIIPRLPATLSPLVRGLLAAVVLVAGWGDFLWADDWSGLEARQEKVVSTAETVRVAAIQFVSDFAEPQQNLERLEQHIRTAAEAGAKIVVLPETAIQGYFSFDLATTWQIDQRTMSPEVAGVSPVSYAEPVPGPTTRRLSQLAGELDLYLTIPLLEVDRKSQRYFNSVILAGPNGEQLLHYRKLNPWPWAERGWCTKGDRGLQYVDTPYGRLGVLVCYDINFEPANLKAAGVDVLLYPIAWVDDAGSQWFTETLPRIAKENSLAIVGANWSVREKPRWQGYGNSVIINFDGQRLKQATAELGDQIIIADLPVRALPVEADMAQP